MLASERKTVCGSGASLSAPRKFGQLDDLARRLLLAVIGAALGLLIFKNFRKYFTCLSPNVLHVKWFNDI